MVCDTQVYLRCAKCGNYVNESESQAHRCQIKPRQGKNFMETGEALYILHDLASAQLAAVHMIVKAHFKPSERQRMFKREQLALDTVHDFIVNNFGE